MAKTKKQIAQEFVNELKSMTPQEINELMVDEAGNELLRFFESYGHDAMLLNLHRPLQAAAALMLTGYLIRAREERSTVIIMPKGKA